MKGGFSSDTFCTSTENVTCNPQELTAGPQKCDAEVLPLPGANSTIQTSLWPDQNCTHRYIANYRVTPLIGHCVLILTWANPVLGPPTHLSWVLANVGQQTDNRHGWELNSEPRTSSIEGRTQVIAPHHTPPTGTHC